MAKSTKRIKIKYRKLGKEQAYGLAEGNRVTIDERLKGKKHLEILLHESLHVLYKNDNEDEIIKKSILLTNTLWHENYRRIDNSNSHPLQDGSK
jgi:hypothetical protein